MRPLLACLRFLPLAALLVLPALAQETPPAPPTEQPPASGEETSKAKTSDKGERFGEIYGEVQTWWVSPSGTEFVPASTTSSGSSYSTNSRIGDDNRTSFRYEVGYRFRNRNLGGILSTYWDSQANDGLNVASPGKFQFFETLPSAPYAGYSNDGLADGYASLTQSVSREFRVDYTRDAFQSGMASGTWLVGYRSFAHQRDDQATYYALVPAFLPPNIEPSKPELIPVADLGQSSSAFSGNGFEAGLNLSFEVNKKVAIETGFTAAMIWGTLETGYYTKTSAYILNQGQSDESVLPASQYQQEFGENPTLTGISQQSFSGTALYKQSANVLAMDVCFGARWKAWRGLEVSAGFRGARYDNAVAQMQPKDTGTDLASGSTLIQSTTLTRSAVTFYGFFAAVGYRY